MLAERNKVTRELENSNACPCCGHVLDAAMPVVDLNTNMVAFQNRRWRVTPKVAEFLYAIARHAPKPVPLLDIGFAMWGEHSPYDKKLNDCLAVYAWHVRKMLNNSGVSVEHINNRGYRLFVEEKT